MAADAPPWAGLAGLVACGAVHRSTSRRPRRWSRPVGTALGVVALGVVASSLAARADAGATPVERRAYDGPVTLVSDPERFGPSVRADVRIEGRRLEAWARGEAAARLAPRLAGERLEVHGRVSPLSGDAPWLRIRHVVGRMAIDGVDGWSTGHPAARAANGVRRTLASGASSMSEDHRALYLGFLLGDDRGQSPLVVDAFRGSGLSHLLAVSGSNVAFVLALAAPMLARTSIGGRLVATVALLAFFALLTRFEPSVLRATVMAGTSAAAVATGRAAESRRILPLTVIVLLLVDPFLARSLAFRLSVAASAGIIWWSGRLSSALPGPRSVASALGVTAAAQLAVAPLLVPAFGAMPVAALPANLLAGPAAGLIVMWGIPAGLIAGVLGAPVAGWIHLPTEVAVGWVALIAERSARLPLGDITAGHLLVLGPAVAVLAVGGGAVRRVAVVAVVAALVHPAWTQRAPSDGTVELGHGGVVHMSGGAVVVELDADVRVDDVLEGLRRLRVGRIDAVVARHGGRATAEAVALLSERAPPRLVLAPRGHRVPGGSVPTPGRGVRVGPLRIDVLASSPRLEVSITPS